MLTVHLTGNRRLHLNYSSAMSPVAFCPMHAIHLSIVVLLAATYMHVPGTAIIVVPSSNCYTFDNESRLIDFTHLVGKEYEYNEQGSEPPDLVVEFCKDVQRRSQKGYIEFGRFVSSRSFLLGSGPTDYIQKFHDGDLVHCETTFEKMGRTAQVNIICGHCSNNACRGLLPVDFSNFHDTFM